MHIQERVSLKAYNTLGFDVDTRFFVCVENLDQLREATSFAQHKKLPMLLLGGGSNIVLTQNFSGLAIYLALQGKSLAAQGHDFLLQVQAGENWHQVVQWSLQQSAFGIENLSLIPGNIGAAPIQNIGAYGVELKDVFHSLNAMQLSTGDVHSFSADDCQFAYRDSCFKGDLKDQYAIISVNLLLSSKENLKTQYGVLQSLIEQKQQPLSAQLVSDVVCEVRSSKLPDPKQLGNAGSFFKNPVIEQAHADSLKTDYPHLPCYAAGEGRAKLAAGWLVEQAGFKGCTRLGVGVHEQQALVLVNRGTGNGQQLLALAQEIQQVVKDKFSVALEIEPRSY
jgi:UDP-N-acetylmuramate dehydrogenase